MKIELTSEQIKVLGNKNKGHSLIKGVAGSGKTTIALYKIFNLLQENEGESVLLLTYNKTLIAYMKYLCKKNDIHLSEKQFEVRTIDSCIYSLLDEKKYVNITRNEQRDILHWAIQQIQEKYGKDTIAKTENIDFLLEEFSWMKSCRYVDRKEYLNVDRIGRMDKGKVAKRLQKQGEDRYIIYELFKLYENGMVARGRTDFYTSALRVLNRMESGKILPREQYSYIIVDECQDLSRVQLEIIGQIYKRNDESCILFLTDVAQSIYMHSWLSKHSFKSVGFNMAGKSNILSKNYRTTKQIAMAAYSLLRKDMSLNKSDDFVEPVLVDRNGAKPQYHAFDGLGKELDFLECEIKKLLMNNKYDLCDIAIVAKTWNYLEDVRIHLLNHGLDAHLLKGKKSDAYYEEGKIQLITLHSSKGLEFPVVFIVGINDKILPYSDEKEEEERKLLYVGMTRAKELLYMSSSGKESRFISEISPEHFSDSSQIREYYEVPFERYLHNGCLKNNPEEKVRQWYIEQLLVHYGYPRDLIQTEYKIQYGSRTFYGDIAVFRSYGQKNHPFILVEVKKKDEDLSTAYKQIQSYLLPNNTPEYIVITNGREINVQKVSIGGKTENFKLNFTTVTDIPFYGEADTLTYQYDDLQHKRSRMFKQDCGEKNLFYLCEGDNERMAEGCTLQLWGKVAAGVLKTANIRDIKAFQLPREILSNVDGVYALKVDGDSMIDFGIENQDIVIVKSQAKAEDGDLVVAGSNKTDELTLKRFERNGRYVILHPGNPKYEDIYIPLDEYFMNGIVIGVVKNIS